MEAVIILYISGSRSPYVGSGHIWVKIPLLLQLTLR